MNEMENPRFAAFLINQQRKTRILQEDHNIQQAGIQEEKRNWHIVQKWCKQNSDDAGVQLVQQELAALTSEEQHLSCRQKHLTQVQRVVNELAVLPNVGKAVKRIADAQETIDNKWRPLI